MTGFCPRAWSACNKYFPFVTIQGGPRAIREPYRMFWGGVQSAVTVVQPQPLMILKPKLAQMQGRPAPRHGLLCSACGTPPWCLVKAGRPRRRASFFLLQESPCALGSGWLPGGVGRAPSLEPDPSGFSPRPSRRLCGYSLGGEDSPYSSAWLGLCQEAGQPLQVYTWAHCSGNASFLLSSSSPQVRAHPTFLSWIWPQMETWTPTQMRLLCEMEIVRTS